MAPPIKPCPEKTNDETFVFSLIGLVATLEFQKCLAYIETLNKVYPDIYLKPYIRPMLEFDWLEYVTKMQRKMGGEFWHLKKNCVVFVNKDYLGNDDDLMEFVGKRLIVKLKRDYECLSQKGLLDVYQKYIELGRRFIYISVAVNHHVIGHMIFMLYADLVPKTCRRFIKKCTSKKRGFKGTAIHRIMASSWIQFGDYKLPLKNHSCENYRIPHNRRGVLSRCNDGRHTHNTSQFFVCLNPTDWMDYHYVAFGQLVQGDHVLRELETKPTYYEHPEPDELVIADCGEITLEDTVRAKDKRILAKYLAARDRPGHEMIDIEDERDTASILLEAHYLAGDYFFEDDNESHLPMRNLPSVEQSTVSLTLSSISAEGEMLGAWYSSSLLLQDYFYDSDQMEDDTIFRDRSTQGDLTEYITQMGYVGGECEDGSEKELDASNVGELLVEDNVGVEGNEQKVEADKAVDADKAADVEKAADADKPADVEKAVDVEKAPDVEKAEEAGDAVDANQTEA